MGIVYSEYQSLFLAFRVDVVHQFTDNRLVERIGNHLPIETFHFQFQLVFQFCKFLDVVGLRIIGFRSLTFLPHDALRIQFGLYNIRRSMINQIPVNHRFTIRVGKDRCPEYLGCMKRGSSRQSDDRGIKVFDDTFVLADIIRLVSESQVFFVQFPVFVITSVCFIHNDAVIGINGQTVLFLIGGIEQSLDHTLNRCELYPCIHIRVHFTQPIYLVDVCKGVKVFYLVFLEFISRLTSQCSSVRQEQDASETV